MARPQQKKTNWFAIWVTTGVVVAAAAVVAVVVIGNVSATSPGTEPKASNINAQTGAISFGTGETTVDTYVDFMCPICGNFEDQYGAELQAKAASDDITLNIHPVSILNGASQGTKFSTRAASAMYCVAEQAPEASLDFFNAMWENRPQENSAGLSDDELTKIATDAGAGAAASCIADGTFTRFVDYQTKAREIRGTPTIEVNGTRLDNAQIPAEMAKILG